MTPTPASDLIAGDIVALVSVGPIKITSTTKALDPAEITLHYEMLDSVAIAPNNTGYVTVLRTQLFEAPT